MAGLPPLTLLLPVAAGVEVAYSRGLPQITVPLPSRCESCDALT